MADTSIVNIALCEPSAAAPSDLPSFGTILYRDASGLHLLHDNSSTLLELPVSDPDSYAVIGFSPHGEWLALAEKTRVSSDQALRPLSVILVSSAGETRRTAVDLSAFRVEPDMFISGFYPPITWYWVDDQILYAPVEMRTLPIGSQHYRPLPALLDPFSGIWQTDLLKDIPSLQAWRMAGFSPDLQRVLYEGEDGYLTLWNMADSRPMWTDKETPLYNGAEIAWAPSGETAAYTPYDAGVDDDRRVFLVDRDGAGRRPVPAPPDAPINEYYSGLAWAHDGRYLAFNGSVDEGTTTTLYIFDLITNHYMLRCPFEGSPSGKPQWSPDDRYVGLGGQTLDIADWKSGQVTRLLENGHILGWSESFSP